MTASFSQHIGHYTPIASLLSKGRVVMGDILREGRKKLPKRDRDIPLFSHIGLDPQEIDRVFLFANIRNNCILLHKNGFLKLHPAFDIVVLTDVVKGIATTPQPEDLEGFLIESLNPDIIKTLSHIGYKVTDISLEDYNWLLGETTIEVTDFWQKIKNIYNGRFKHANIARYYTKIKIDGYFRHQAITAYPLLPFILNAKSEKADLVTHDIDKSHSLIESLQTHLDLPKWFIRRLNDFSIHDFTTDSEKNNILNFRPILNLAPYLDPNLFPATIEEWEKFSLLVNFASKLFSHECHSLDEKRDLTHVADGVMKTQLMKINAEEISRLHARDVTDDLHRNLISPFLLYGDIWNNRYPANLSRAITERLLYCESFNRTAEKINWWHRHSLRIKTALRREYSNPEAVLRYWEPITEQFTTEEGWTVTPLVDEESLWAEGQEMAHCVGNYGHVCAIGHSHILSIRNPYGERMSTVEIDETKLLKSIEETKPIEGVIKQHYGKKNTRPSMEAQNTLQSWFDAIRNENLSVDFTFLEDRRNIRQKSDKGKILDVHLACYQASLEEARISAWHHYSQLLPSHVKARGPEGFLQTCNDLGEIIHQNNKNQNL